MQLLYEARDRAKELCIKVESDVIKDNFGWRIAWNVVYPNGERGILMASDYGHIVPGRGYCKSMDSLLVDEAEESNVKLLLYIKKNDAFYGIDPKDIKRYAEGLSDNRRFSGEGLCPLCGDEMSVELEHTWEHSCEYPLGNRYEVHNHRLKYHDLPLPKVFATNLNATMQRPMSDAEKILDPWFKDDEDLRRFKYMGNSLGVEPVYGWQVDWAWGPWIVEYDGKGHSKDHRRERREKAARHGCQPPYFIRVPPEDLERKKPEILSNIRNYLRSTQRKL